MSDRHTIQPYPLRLQPELRASLDAAAKENGRSLHAEIVQRLEASLMRDSLASEGAIVATIPVLMEEPGGELLIREIIDRVVDRVLSEDEMERFQALQNKKKPK